MNAKKKSGKCFRQTHNDFVIATAPAVAARGMLEARQINRLFHRTPRRSAAFRFAEAKVRRLLAATATYGEHFVKTVHRGYGLIMHVPSNSGLHVPLTVYPHFNVREI